MSAVRVDEFGAFGVNTIGLQGSPFPLSISVGQSEGVWTVHATAARAYDLVDVLGTDAHGTAVVLNVGQNSWLTDDYSPWLPRQIARQQHVTFAAHDIRWAASPRFQSTDLLVMAWRDLRRFLDGWSHYDIEILDVPGPVGDAEADELALTINTHDVASCLLPHLPGSRVYYTGHDDCYVYAEATDPRLPARLLTRLLALFAGAALLADDTDSVTVPEPEESLTADLLRQCRHWVGTVLDAQPGRTVTLGLTPSDKIWRLSDPVPRGTPRRLTLDVENGEWNSPPAQDDP